MLFYRTKLAILGLLIGFSYNVRGSSAPAQLVGDDLKFPYQAFVLLDGAPVRSGPGEVHYSTSALKQGATVEVYRHDPGGWCAIRPPRGSFSLVPASAVEVVATGVGEITETGTQAWVGTQLGAVDQPLWQIKLRAGESVELLGEANWPEPDGQSSAWYQIAPPAGEFRWIHLADLRLPPASARQANPAITQSQTSVQPASYQGPSLELAPPRSANSNAINQGWRQASQAIDKSTIDDNKSGSLSRASDLLSTPAISDRSFAYGALSNERMASTYVDPRFDLEQLSPSTNGRTHSSVASRLPDSFGPANRLALPMGNYAGSQPQSLRLTELELRLNQEMIKEPNQWRLIDLQAATQSISDSTQDPVEQLQSQRLLAKLENCREIRTNYLRAFNINGAAETDNGGLTEQEFSLNTIYDAHGWLNELVRDGGTKRSTYVLQNDAGKITHHISPGPGMNLSSYLKTKVGIIGQRGFHTELKLNHVTAERVIELKKR